MAPISMNLTTTLLDYSAQVQNITNPVIPTALTSYAKYQCSYHNHTTTVFQDSSMLNSRPSELFLSTASIAPSLFPDETQNFYCYVKSNNLHSVTCQYEGADTDIRYVLPMKHYQRMGYLVREEYDHSLDEYSSASELFASYVVPDHTVSCINYDLLQTPEELGKLRLGYTSWFEIVYFYFNFLVLIVSGLAFISGIGYIFWGWKGIVRRNIHIINVILFNGLLISGSNIIKYHFKTLMLFSAKDRNYYDLYGEINSDSNAFAVAYCLYACYAIVRLLMLNPLCYLMFDRMSKDRKRGGEILVEECGLPITFVLYFITFSDLYQYIELFMDIDNTYVYILPVSTYLYTPTIHEVVGQPIQWWIMIGKIFYGAVSLLSVLVMIPSSVTVMRTKDVSLFIVKTYLISWIFSVVTNELSLAISYGTSLCKLNESFTYASYLILTPRCLVVAIFFTIRCDLSEKTLDGLRSILDILNDIPAWFLEQVHERTLSSWRNMRTVLDKEQKSEEAANSDTEEKTNYDDIIPLPVPCLKCNN